MAKQVNYVGNDGRYDDHAYHQSYRENNKDKVALWQLRAALKNSSKYPSIQPQVKALVAEFMGAASIAGGDA